MVWVNHLLDRFQSVSKKVRSLTIVPNSMVTTKSMMVGYCSALVDHCFGGSGLYRPKLFDQLCFVAKCVPSEIRCWPIRIKVCKANRTCARATCNLADRPQGRFFHLRLEFHVAIPGDAAFRGVSHHATRDRVLAEVRATQEFVTPISGSPASLRVFLC